MDDVQEWLRSLGLDEHAPRFAQNDIDMSVVGELTEQDLKELGVSLGHRRKLLRAIASMAVATPARSTANPVGGQASPGISSAEATAERRQLTVMFCDLVGSTALAAR